MAKKAGLPAAEHWKSEPDSHDYPAAASYLSLVLGEAATDSVVADLEKAPIEHHKAKDLLAPARSRYSPKTTRTSLRT